LFSSCRGANIAICEPRSPAQSKWADGHPEWEERGLARRRQSKQNARKCKEAKQTNATSSMIVRWECSLSMVHEYCGVKRPSEKCMSSNRNAISPTRRHARPPLLVSWEARSSQSKPKRLWPGRKRSPLLQSCNISDCTVQKRRTSRKQTTVGARAGDVAYIAAPFA